MLTAEQINLIQIATTKSELFAIAPEQEWGCTASFLSKHMTRVPSDLHMQDNHISAFGWLWYTLSNSTDGDALYYPSGPMDYSNDFSFSFPSGHFTQEERELDMAKYYCHPHGKPDVDNKPRVNHEATITTLPPPDQAGVVKYLIKTKCGKIAFVGRFKFALKYLESAQDYRQKGGRLV